MESELEIFSPNVKAMATASETHPPSQQTPSEPLPSAPCSLLRSLLVGRSHAKDHPTTLNGSTVKPDGSAILEFKVYVPVSKEEKEEVDKYFWGQEIVIQG